MKVPTADDAAKVKMTKRQRRKQGPNPANTWQQQPSIKSPAARARAYIADAGLYQSKSSAKKPNKTDVLDPTLDLNSPEVKFGRMLGGTDQRSRHKAVAKLRDYLRARCDLRNVNGGISELDMMKLWKGMWYTLYMADKVPVQDELSKRLAELIWCFAGTEEEDEYAAQVYLDMDEGERDDFGSGGLDDGEEELDEDEEQEQEDSEEDSDDEEYEVHMEVIENTLNSDENDDDEDDEEEEDAESAEEIDESLIKHCRGAHLASLYVRTFFRTMRREWGNVDKHRVDKFYTAMRLILAQVFKYMAKRHWNLGIIRLFNDTLFEEVLSQTPNGLRFHLIDITLDELAKANRDADLPLTEATFLDCLEPYFALAQTSEDKIVQSRIMENVLTRFLTDYSVVSDNAQAEDEDDEAGELIFREVHVGSVAKFIFEVGSDGDTDDRYRKGLYDLHKKYQRMIAAVGTDVDMEERGEQEGDEEDFASYGGEMADCEEAEDEDIDSEEEEEEPDTVVETPKEKSKKKKKSNKRKNSADAEDEENFTPQAEEKASKKKKSKKKKKQERDDGDDNVTSEVIDPSTFITPTKSSKKSPKERQQHTGSDDEEEDDIVNISVKEQKRAASAQKKKSAKKDKKGTKKERKMSIEEQEEEERRKRVSFGAVNHSKSYKASMKDLRKREVPSTALLTPDRSILLEAKHSKSADGKSGKKGSKGKRPGAPATEPRKRRAVDYF